MRGDWHAGLLDCGGVRPKLLGDRAVPVAIGITDHAVDPPIQSRPAALQKVLSAITDVSQLFVQAAHDGLAVCWAHN